MFKLYWQKFILPYWPLISVALVCYVIASAAGLSAPLIIKFLIDDALCAVMFSIYILLLQVLLLYTYYAVFFFLYSWANNQQVGNRMVEQVRSTMFQRLQKLDYAYFINTPTGEIISLFTNDLLLIQKAVSVSVPLIGRIH